MMGIKWFLVIMFVERESGQRGWGPKIGRKIDRKLTEMGLRFRDVSGTYPAKSDPSDPPGDKVPSLTIWQTGNTYNVVVLHYY